VVNISVVSSDRAIIGFCRAILDPLLSSQCRIEQFVQSENATEADILIWDAETLPTIPPPMAKADGSAKLVIVSKSSQSSICRSLPHAEYSILNIPWTSLSLRVFLESAVSRLQLDAPEGPGQLALGRDRILQRLLETNSKLQEYDRDRTNFLTRAVHDIRVPLMAVDGYCGLLLAGQLGPLNAEQAQILERMKRSLSRLGGLAESMMQLGAGGAISANAHLEPGSLEACVNHAMTEVLPIAEQKQISFHLDLEPHAGTLLVDSAQMQRVLVNLIDNSCKFTPKNGSIEIRGYNSVEQFSPQIRGAGYRIDISDTGPGISPERVESVFDEFTSYGGSADRSGAGLGLAICRTIVQAHNGRIWASQESQGATFSLALPYEREYLTFLSTDKETRAAV
jgi:signal transduction histidine kinase